MLPASGLRATLMSYGHGSDERCLWCANTVLPLLVFLTLLICIFSLWTKVTSWARPSYFNGMHINICTQHLSTYVDLKFAGLLAPIIFALVPTILVLCNIMSMHLFEKILNWNFFNILWWFLCFYVKNKKI
jgi:hypothetical protein